PKFGHIANLFGMCYDKGSKVVGMIEDRLGPDGFVAFIHRLHDRYRYRIIRVADVQRELEEFTGHSWDEFFKRWLYGPGLCDWAVDKVTIEPVPGAEGCKATVLLSQRGDYCEPTTLGFCLDACGKKDDERLPYQVRVPILPQAEAVQDDALHARVETLPDHR